MTTVSESVARTLAGHARDVFGVMGNGNAYFLDAVERQGMRFTAVRHEAGGVAAADTYYRANGRLAVATATYGAGFTNTLTALAESVQARIPLVLLVGDAPTTGARPWDVDQAALAAALGSRTFTVTAADAGAVTAAAVEHALNARAAVVLAIPYDLASAPSAERAEAPPVELAPRVVPDAAALDAAALLLAEARRPVLLAGRGAHLAGAGAALGRLAEALGAVTASSALGRGLFPDTRYDLGVAGGFGQDEAMRLVESADVVLVVGAGLNPFTTRFGELFGRDARVIQVDVAEAPTHVAVDRFVRGDARLAAEALLERLRDARPSGWRESLPGLADGRYRERDGGAVIAGDGRLDPRSLANRLEEILPGDRVVVSDGGHFIGWANTHWSVASPERMIMVGTAYQTIGLGLPSMVGAAVAMPDSTIVLTTGDGGALMALADLESAVRAVRRGVIVVWNDAAYGAEVHLYGARGLAEAPMLIPETDFAALARAVGARASVVRELDDLAEVAEWLASGADGVHLLDCRISRTVVAPYQEEIVAAAARR